MNFGNEFKKWEFFYQHFEVTVNQDKVFSKADRLNGM